MRPSDLSCLRCPRRRTGVFGAASRAALERLDHEKVAQSIVGGRHLYHEGGPALAAYCVTRGMVRLRRVGARSSELLMEIKGPGSLLGLPATLCGEPHGASAVTASRVDVCAIPRHVLLDLLAREPAFAVAVANHLARTSLAYVDKVVDFACRRVPQRVAGLLADLARARECWSAGTTVLRVRRVELAQMAGTSPETVSRILGRLRAHGLIEVSRTEITVIRPDQLRLVRDGRRRA